MQRSSSIPAGGGGATQACAVCKYQRRKCSADCPLAPFFPANNRSDFLNAHKLFGVSNITKILRDLDPHNQFLAVKSIIFQSNVRALDPVGGCYRIICDLHRQIHLIQAELNLVLSKLAHCRAHFDAEGCRVYHDVTTLQRRLQFCVQEPRNGFDDFVSLGHGNSVKPELGASCSSSSGHSAPERKDFPDVGDDIRPLLGVFYEKAEAAAAAVPLDSNQLLCSGNGVLKEDMTSEEGEKHDLKNAASFFSLTNGKE